MTEIPPQFCARFRESANRPHLLLGCEPTAIAAAFVLCVVIGYSAPTLWGIGGAISLFFVLRHGLRAMAAEDPILDWNSSRQSAVPARILDREAQETLRLVEAVNSEEQERSSMFIEREARRGGEGFVGPD